MYKRIKLYKCIKNVSNCREFITVYNLYLTSYKSLSIQTLKFETVGITSLPYDHNAKCRVSFKFIKKKRYI